MGNTIIRLAGYLFSVLAVAAFIVALLLGIGQIAEIGLVVYYSVGGFLFLLLATTCLELTRPKKDEGLKAWVATPPLLAGGVTMSVGSVLQTLTILSPFASFIIICVGGFMYAGGCFLASKYR